MNSQDIANKVAIVNFMQERINKYPSPFTKPGEEALIKLGIAKLETQIKDSVVALVQETKDVLKTAPAEDSAPVAASVETTPTKNVVSATRPSLKEIAAARKKSSK